MPKQTKQSIIYEVLRKSAELRMFIKAFHSRLADENIARAVSLTRTEEEKRHDAAGRLLTGDETCAAVAVQKDKILVSTNQNNHSQAVASIQLQQIVYRAGSTPENMQLVATFELTTNTGYSKIVNSAPITFRRNAAKDFLHPTDRKLHFTIFPSEHHIPEYPYRLDFEMGLASIPAFSSGVLLVDIINTMSNGPIYRFSLDPFKRRAERLFTHLGSIALYELKDRPKTKKSFTEAINRNRVRVLIQTLGWEAPTWFKLEKALRKYSLDDLSKQERKIYEKKKAQITELHRYIETLEKELAEFLGTHFNESEDKISNVINQWIQKKFIEIENSKIAIPDFMKNKAKLFFARARRYWHDLLLWENYIAAQARQGQPFPKVLASLAVKLHLMKDPDDAVRLREVEATNAYFRRDAEVVVVDDLADGAHAELRLFSHMRGEKPVYMGITQLCCANCHLFLKSHGIDYEEGSRYRAGKHAKHYPGWVFDPQLATEENLKAFFGQAYDLYGRLSGDFTYEGETHSLKEWALWIIEDLGSLSQEMLGNLGFSKDKIWFDGSNFVEESEDEELLDEEMDSTLDMESQFQFFHLLEPYDMQEFRNYLHERFGLETTFVPGDGDCQFRSIARYLGYLDPVRYTALSKAVVGSPFALFFSENAVEDVVVQRLRYEAMDYIETHSAEFEAVIAPAIGAAGVDPVQDVGYVNAQDYLDQMGRAGHYGDEITLRAMAHVLNRPIIVLHPSMQTDKRNYQIYQPHDGEIDILETIILVFNGTNHYETVNKTPNETFIKLINGESLFQTDFVSQ